MQRFARALWGHNKPFTSSLKGEQRSYVCQLWLRPGQ